VQAVLLCELWSQIGVLQPEHTVVLTVESGMQGFGISQLTDYYSQITFYRGLIWKPDHTLRLTRHKQRFVP